MAADNTKNKIVSVATKLFGRYGFHKTSMDEIAKIARKAKGSLYYHFADKENLFTEVVAVEFENLKAQLSVVVKYDLPATEKFKMYLIKRMEILHSAVNYHETLKADFFEHFDFIDNIRHELDEWEKSKMRQILQEGIDSGEFIEMDNTDVILDVFIMVLKGLDVPLFIQDKYHDLRPYLDGMLDILIRGISK